MSNDLDTAKTILVTAADTIVNASPGTPAGAIAGAARIVIEGIDGIIHAIEGDDLERARANSQALHQAAGASADLNSRLPGLRNALDSILLPLIPNSHDSAAINEAASNVRKSYVDAIVREIVRHF